MGGTLGSAPIGNIGPAGGGRGRARIGNGGIKGAAGAYLGLRSEGGVALFSSSAKAVSAVVGIMRPQASTAAIAPRRSRCWCFFIIRVISWLSMGSALGRLRGLTAALLLPSCR